jgi:molecular chaperone GrpE
LSSEKDIQENEEIKEEVESNEESTDSLKAKILELEEKLQEQDDKYLRVHADFENTKKRLEKEKYQGIEYAKESFAQDLLAVRDSLELAINSVSNIEQVNEDTFDNFKKGIELTIEQFQKAFSKHYVEEISTTDGFDPNLHQAIMQVESEAHDEGQIVTVMQKGYKLRDRVLRPSMVSICKK